MLTKTSEWIGAASSTAGTASTSGQRRQRDNNQQQQQQHAISDDEVASLKEQVWAVASFRIASLKLRVQSSIASVLHQAMLADPASASVSGDQAQQLVDVASRALADFFRTIPLPDDVKKNLSATKQ